jgi:hypothetical protein
MLVLFTDYGSADPYLGQLKAECAQLAPAVPVIDLLHAVPDFNAHAGAHLLDAFCHGFPPGTVFLCVVDPGVGGPRRAIVVEADDRCYVGPDNGLLSVVSARAKQRRIWRIDWQPEGLSSTFHGRDLFAPVAAAIANENFPLDKVSTVDALEVEFTPADLPRIIFIDHYGNAWTGIRGGLMEGTTEVEVKGHRLGYRRTFAEAEKGQPFWHVNSSGLLELAANRANAAQLLGLALGDLVKLPGSPGSRSH